jgi:hypothetical protein
MPVGTADQLWDGTEREPVVTAADKAGGRNGESCRRGLAAMRAFVAVGLTAAVCRRRVDGCSLAVHQRCPMTEARSCEAPAAGVDLVLGGGLAVRSS